MDKFGIFSTDLKPGSELYIYECGFEHCAPRDPYQYEQIDYYLLHYILDGEGLFFMNGEVYHLKKGDGFFIPPHTDNNYYPLEGNPWIYRWIGINGTQAKELLSRCGLSEDNYVFNYTKDNKIDDYFRNIYDSCSSNRLLEGLGYLYQFLSTLMNDHSSDFTNSSPPSKVYISKSIEFIKENYTKNISVSDISDYLNIDRSHFFKIFKKDMMISPQDYIINYKIKQACDLLRKSSYSISEISNSVGFSSPSYFSKIFKKNMDTTPLKYKELFIKNR